MAKEIMIINDNEYAQILQQAVEEIQTARTTIARQINSSVNSVYWNIGKLLFEKNLEGGYGSGVVKRLSIDLKEQFSDMGLSPRNLWNMKRLYERYYQEDTKLLQAVAVLPWGHNLLPITLIQRCLWLKPIMLTRYLEVHIIWGFLELQSLSKS